MISVLCLPLWFPLFLFLTCLNFLSQEADSEDRHLVEQGRHRGSLHQQCQLCAQPNHPRPNLWQHHHHQHPATGESVTKSGRGNERGSRKKGLGGAVVNVREERKERRNWEMNWRQDNFKTLMGTTVAQEISNRKNYRLSKVRTDNFS